MTFSRTLVVMGLLTALALLREVGSGLDFWRHPQLSRTTQTVTVNGVPVRRSLSGEFATGKDLLAYRLAPPPNWPTSSSPPLSPTAGLALFQSTAPGPQDPPRQATRPSSPAEHMP